LILTNGRSSIDSSFLLSSLKVFMNNFIQTRPNFCSSL